ncbi:MAG: polysaccharide deacetylase family protein [Acidimicrobiia bacterium]
MKAGQFLIGAGVGFGAALAVRHAAPVLASVTPIARRVVPTLSGVGRGGHVALTFDDGPDPASTPKFLEVLDAYNVSATFFMLGSMTRRAPSLAAEIAAAGHEIAVHGDEHISMLRRTTRAAIDDVRRAHNDIAELTGTQPRFFRPPYGQLSRGALKAADACGLQTVLWTAWGRDWRAAATPDTVLADLERGTLDGGTVLLHDSDCTSAPLAWRSALGALPDLMTMCAQRGLVVGPLRDHFDVVAVAS